MIRVTTRNSVYYVEDNKVVKIETDNWRPIHDIILANPSVKLQPVVGLSFEGYGWHTSTVQSIAEVSND